MCARRTRGEERTAALDVNKKQAVKTADWRLLETDGAGVRAGLAGVTAGAGAAEEAFSAE